jgi:tRNA dimethylallyltransferase
MVAGGLAVSGRGRPPLLLVLGPTGSGKSELAHAVALHRRGEIVSADAFALYRGLDIGTAKPSARQRGEVRYHLLDVATPGEAFSAGLWAELARPIVETIAARGRLPIVCGGSGFYVSALLDGLPPGALRDDALRDRLARWAERGGAERAHGALRLNDPISAARIPVGNLRYTLRALEIVFLTGRPASSRRPAPQAWTEKYRLIKVGLRPDRAQLHVRIRDRVRGMFEAGWGEEVRGLLEAGVPVDSNSFQAIGYREVAGWVLGHTSRQEAEERIVKATWGLARRQATWLGRERDVLWMKPEEAFAVTLARLDEAARDREAR